MFTSRLSAGVLFALGLAACGSGLRGPTQASVSLTTPPPGAAVSIEGTRFLLNGKVAAPGGLLMNSRMVMGIIDDENPATVGNWAYPDTHMWDPQRNTNEFVAAIPSYAQHGVRLLTVGLQGGCPLHTVAQPHCPGNMAQPWIVTAFNADGSLKSAWMTRLDQVIRAADANGIVILVSLFDKLQNLRVTKQIDAVNNITDWLVTKGYTNVMVETVNECDVGGAGAFTDYLWCGHEAEVIKQVQTRSGGKLKVSVSYGGGRVPDQDVVAQSDFVLLHGNSKNAAGVTAMINELKRTNAYRAAPKPIMINEDSESVDNLNAAVAAETSWGYLDTGFNNYWDGFQSPPVNWTINTDLKKAFFNRTAELSATALKYTGPATTDYHDSVTVVANLADSLDVPIAGSPITFSLNQSDGCTADTDSAGRAACMILPTQAPGSYPIAVHFPGDQAVRASQATGSLQVLTEETVLGYSGDAHLVNGSAAHLSAVLLEDGAAPISGRSIAFSLGAGNRAQTCWALTDAAGKATCQVTTVSQPLGATAVAARFAGDAQYKDATAAAAVTTVPTVSGIRYTGPDIAQFHDALRLSAHLADAAGTPEAGLPISFTLGSQSCTATTDDSGAAACRLTITQAPGTYQVTITFAGNERLTAGSASGSVTVGREEATLGYTGDASLVMGSAANLSATLKEDGSKALASRAVTLTLGSGDGAQRCTATTDDAGSARCSIAAVNQTVGTGQVTASFNGDPTYLPTTSRAAVTVDAAATPTATPPTSTTTPPVLATTGQGWMVDALAVVVGLQLMAVGVALVRRRRQRV